MKKLSEISKDTYICVGAIEGLMTKGDYLQSSYFLDQEDVELCEADPAPVTFDWREVLEWYSDEQHEDWYGDVLNNVKGNADLEKAAEIMNEIFGNNLTYFEGDPIENDMMEVET